MTTTDTDTDTEDVTAWADRVFGEGRWLWHEDCPHALGINGEVATVLHHKASHGRPLRAKPT